MHTLNDIEINAGCRWIDEFDWSPVVSAQSYSIAGSLIVDTGVRLAGRPITLQARDDAGWKDMTRVKVAQLAALAALPEEVLTLVLHDGREFSVRFKPGEEPMTARPLAGKECPEDDWPYIITLRLIEV